MARINRFIVLMLENRSFDHLLGFAEPPAGQTIDNLLSLSSPPSNLLDPSKPESTANPAFAVAQPAPFAVHDKEGPSHSFNAVNTQLAGSNKGPTAGTPSQNIGFVKNYAAELSRNSKNVTPSQIQEVMLSFAPDQLPSLNQLAREFCLCDQWHCEVPGPTLPNRMFIHAATSEGYVHNDFKRTFTSKTVYELFEQKGLTWAAYFHDLNEIMQFPQLSQTPDHFRRFDRWSADVAAGNLPNYTFIFPRFMNGIGQGGETLPANSQHAPEDARFADNLIADIYEPLATNQGLFNESALVITWDEHGGFYDHVIPGDAPNPDGINSPNPDDRTSFAPFFAFDRIGLRVPAVIASPWIQKGSVEHRKLQHTSVIRTVTEIFGLNGPLNRRDEGAASFADIFHQLAQPRTDMPLQLERASLAETVESVVAGVPLDPADEPLDSLTAEWAAGMLEHIRVPQGQASLESVQAVPHTQGEASEVIDGRLRAAGL